MIEERNDEGQFIIPINHSIAALLRGVGMYVIAAIFPGSALAAADVMMLPTNFTSCLNCNLSGLSLMFL